MKQLTCRTSGCQILFASLSFSHWKEKSFVIEDSGRGFWLSLAVCFAGLGGACGYLVGAMDWGHSLMGQALGSEYQVIYFFSALTWGVFLTVHLFSIPEQPLCKERSASVASAPNALRLLSAHSNGYGALAKEPAIPVVPAPITDIRPRSFSALGEANSVTSSAKQPNKEVGTRLTGLLKSPIKKTH